MAPSYSCHTIAMMNATVTVNRLPTIPLKTQMMSLFARKSTVAKVRRTTISPPQATAAKTAIDSTSKTGAGIA